jgi:hypothetical protein
MNTTINNGVNLKACYIPKNRGRLIKRPYSLGRAGAGGLTHIGKTGLGGVFKTRIFWPSDISAK